MAIFARAARLAHGWGADVRVTLAEGRIASVTEGAAPRDGDALVDALIPAPGNLHSHAFQRAMAGMTERRVEGRDSFWSWRRLMYRFLDVLTPDQVEAIAAQAYVEMLEAGFAAVGEFHYLHHRPGGAPYDDPAEMSARICAAAQATGIGLTLLPVLYTYGGAGRAPLTGGQLRFGAGPDRFAELAAAAARHVAALPEDARIGIAPHSLRATCPEDLARVCAGRGGPIHIHAAEQPREVEEILAWLGARPVEWLLGSADVGPDWCVVHATHMTADETARLARSGATAGLCPITEADLGDGLFDGPGWMAAGGAFGTGTDSNLRISMVEELRLLEFGQRLRDRSRNVLSQGGSTGETLHLGAARGAARALDRDAGVIAKGRLADLASLDRETPSLCGLDEDRLLDGLIFASGREAIRDVWSAGRRVVRDGRHVAREPIRARFRATMARIGAAL